MNTTKPNINNINVDAETIAEGLGITEDTYTHLRDTLGYISRKCMFEEGYTRLHAIQDLRDKLSYTQLLLIAEILVKERTDVIMKTMKQVLDK